MCGSPGGAFGQNAHLNGQLLPSCCGIMGVGWGREGLHWLSTSSNPYRGNANTRQPLAISDPLPSCGYPTTQRIKHNHLPDNISMNAGSPLNESLGVSLTPFRLPSFPYPVVPLSHPHPIHHRQELKNRYKKIVAVLVAYYLFDPLGTRFRSWGPRNWVLRRGLGKESSPPISIFPPREEAPQGLLERKGWAQLGRQRRHKCPLQHLPNFVALPGGAFHSRIEKGAEPAGAGPWNRRQGEGAATEQKTTRASTGLQVPVQGPGDPHYPRVSRRGEGKQPRSLTAPTRLPSAAAAVAMRCRETPVNKPCLDSGARAQGLFA